MTKSESPAFTCLEQVGVLPPREVGRVFKDTPGAGLPLGLGALPIRNHMEDYTASLASAGSFVGATLARIQPHAHSLCEKQLTCA